MNPNVSDLQNWNNFSSLKFCNRATVSGCQLELKNHIGQVLVWSICRAQTSNCITSPWKNCTGQYIVSFTQIIFRNWFYYYSLLMNEIRLVLKQRSKSKSVTMTWSRYTVRKAWKCTTLKKLHSTHQSELRQCRMKKHNDKKSCNDCVTKTWFSY